MRDLKSGVGYAATISPAAARTATVTGTGVDLQGYEGVAVVFLSGTITDGTHTPKVQESSDNSTFTDVASTDLLGTLSALTSSADVRVGYIGIKRYIRAVVTVTGSPATGGFYDAFVALGYGSDQPVVT